MSTVLSMVLSVCAFVWRGHGHGGMVAWAWGNGGMGNGAPKLSLGLWAADRAGWP